MGFYLFIIALNVSERIIRGFCYANSINQSNLRPLVSPKATILTTLIAKINDYDVFEKSSVWETHLKVWHQAATSTVKKFQD